MQKIKKKYHVLVYITQSCIRLLFFFIKMRSIKLEFLFFVRFKKIISFPDNELLNDSVHCTLSIYCKNNVYQQCNERRGVLTWEFQGEYGTRFLRRWGYIMRSGSKTSQILGTAVTYKTTKNITKREYCHEQKQYKKQMIIK